MSSEWRGLLGSEEGVKLIARQPHLFGHIVGKDKLLPLHSEWIRYVWDSDVPRALQSLRGGYKTTAICTIGSIRWFLFNPNDRVCLVRKHFGNAAEVVNSVAAAMDLPQTQELFKYRHGEYAKFKVRRDGQLTFSFKKTFTPEPSLLALGLDGEFTGKHFDKIIADDFVSRRDRYSRAERKSTKLAVLELATNIIDPGKGSGWIGTPWHLHDAWEVVRSICPIAKYPAGRFNIIGEEELAKKKRMTTPSLYAANYDLELTADESLLFKDPVFLEKGWDFTNRKAVAQLDTAFDGDHYCAMTIAAPTRKEGENQFYQGIGFTYPGNVEDWEPDIERLCNKYNVKHLWVETNADKAASARRLSKRGITVKGYAEGMNKHYKISSHLYHAWPYIEWDEETDDEYMSQVTEYKEGVQPDDAPDSAASLFKQEFSGGSVVLDDSDRAFFHGGG